MRRPAPGSPCPIGTCSPLPAYGAIHPNGGPAYAMVMTEACIHVAEVHDRMPVILRPEEWSDWLDGPPDAAGLLCKPYPDLMTVNRTLDPWVRSRGA